jgi:hypothetical protein
MTDTAINTYMNALDELEAAHDTLKAKVADIIEDLDPVDDVTAEQDNFGNFIRVMKEPTDLRRDFNHAQKATAKAIADFDWRVARALRSLKRASP